MPSGSALFVDQAIETSFPTEMTNPRTLRNSFSFLSARGGKINRQNLLGFEQYCYKSSEKEANIISDYLLLPYLHIYPCSFLFLYFVLNDHYLDHPVGLLVR